MDHQLAYPNTLEALSCRIHGFPLSRKSANWPAFFLDRPGAVKAVHVKRPRQHIHILQDSPGKTARSQGRGGVRTGQHYWNKSCFILLTIRSASFRCPPRFNAPKIRLRSPDSPAHTNVRSFTRTIFALASIRSFPPTMDPLTTSYHFTSVFCESPVNM